MREVRILLSTYNGEKYIEEQINSIINQSYENWQLIIRDDGSKDGTLSIIKDFTSKDARISAIHGNNVGVIKSFYELVKSGEADYYFFCDQDDVWLPDKLEIMLQEAEKEEKDTPLMVYSDLKVVDKNKNVLSESMIQATSGPANTSLAQELGRNSVTGCASMINHALAKLWVETDDIIMHDWYLAQLASLYGKLVFVNQPTVLYRQHESNVIGGKKISILVKIKDLFLTGKYFQRLWKEIRDERLQASQLVSNLIIEDNMNVTMVREFVSLSDFSFKKRVAIVSKYSFWEKKTIRYFFIKVLATTNLGFKS